MSEQINIFYSIFLKHGQLQLLRDMKTCTQRMHAAVVTSWLALFVRRRVGEFHPGAIRGGLRHFTAVGERSGTRPSACHYCGRAELPCDRLSRV